jgi:DNA-binding PucR family transcriptional regulator
MSTVTPAATVRATSVRKLELATGTLASAAIARMDETLPWYRAMSAEERSWIGLVAQAGIAAFVSWFREPEKPPTVTADVFGTAPRELARAVTLQQAVEMVRLTIEVTEDRIEHILSSEEAPLVREGLLRYSREVAFAAAEIYARVAEARGAWDARLEASLVDALLRGEADESVRSRAAALGWGATGGVTVVVGHAPQGEAEAVIDAVRRAARHAHLDVLAGVQGDRLVTILGGATNPLTAASAAAGQFAPGPVVVGPIVDDLVAASASARVAVAGLRAAPGWPEAPRPVQADMLLPERALSGDGHARRALVTDIYGPVAAAGPVLLETLSAFLEHGGSVEATARSLFVHPNTVRYRLRRVTDLTGCVPSDPRDSYTLRMALTMGRLIPHAT